MTITADKFETTWNSSSSAKEAAQKLEMSYGSARKRAYEYRQLGYNLKKFTPGIYDRKPKLKEEA